MCVRCKRERSFSIVGGERDERKKGMYFGARADGSRLREKVGEREREFFWDKGGGRKFVVACRTLGIDEGFRCPGTETSLDEVRTVKVTRCGEEIDS